MNLDEELRGLLVAEAERQQPPPADPVGILTRARVRRQRRSHLLAGVAATAATAALVLGLGVLGLLRVDGAAPQPASPPPVITAPALPDAYCLGDGCLPPGTWAIGLDERSRPPLLAELTVPGPGWLAHKDVNRISRVTADGAVVLNVYRPVALASPVEPCAAPDPLGSAPTADDVTARLSALAQFRVLEGPAPVSSFGQDATHLRVRADRIECDMTPGQDQYNLADFAGGDSDIDPGRPVVLDLWVLDLEGRTIVVEARQEGTPTPGMVGDLDRLLGTVRFGVVEEPLSPSPSSGRSP